jgi:hypothetical protein
MPTLCTNCHRFVEQMRQDTRIMAVFIFTLGSETKYYAGFQNSSSYEPCLGPDILLQINWAPGWFAGRPVCIEALNIKAASNSLRHRRSPEQVLHLVSLFHRGRVCGAPRFVIPGNCL